MIFNSGGGSDLNFKVLAYASEEALLSASPSGNAVGLITTTDVAGYCFSITEPETPVEGFVWIQTSANSTAEFNALKKDSLFVYPRIAYQYISGAWVVVPAKTYADGEWKEWVTYLFKEGDQCKSLTGGWSGVSEGSETIEVSGSIDQYGGSGVSTQTNATIDLTPFSTLSCVALSDVTFFVKNTSGTTTASVKGTGTLNLDISTLTGEHYVCFSASAINSSAYVNASEVKLF